jgi:hypothetical protein
MMRVALEELLGRTRSFTGTGAREGARMPEMGFVSAQLQFDAA